MASLRRNVARPTCAPLADPAAEAAAATARRGAEFLAAVDVKQRPLVAYLARSKIPRINRCTHCCTCSFA